MALDALKLKWSSPSLQRNGRNGQAQSGVDIYGPDELGRVVGVQCKLTEDELTLDEIENEIEKAESFEPPLHAFYIATSGRRDAKIQKQVRLLSDRRIAEKKFPIGILFWDDVADALAGSPAEFQKHFPQIQLASSHRDNITSAQREDLLQLALQHKAIYEAFMAKVRGRGGAVSRERPSWIQHARAAAQTCADAYRKAGDEVSALSWEHVAKTTL